MKKNSYSRRNAFGPKASVTTLAIRAGLVAGDDGQIYDAKNFDSNLANLLAEKGYEMCPKKASKKIRTWANNKSRAVYGF